MTEVCGKLLLEIYERDAIVKHFDEHPNESLTVYVPASGSWCETFDNKEQYLKRMEAWDNYHNAYPSWYDLRGAVSHPWMKE